MKSRPPGIHLGTKYVFRDAEGHHVVVELTYQHYNGRKKQFIPNRETPVEPDRRSDPPTRRESVSHTRCLPVDFPIRVMVQVQGPRYEKPLKSDKYENNRLDCPTFKNYGL
jgi:hypothetical protein